MAPMTDPDIAARVAALVSDLTLREKVGQLNQRLLGWHCVRPGPRGWETTDVLHAEVERWGGLGALYGLFRADAWSGRHWRNGIRPEERAEVAATVVAEVSAASRHGIGPLLVEEAPHGHQALGADLLPVNLAVGATWDPDLYAEACAAVATALRADGVHLALVSTLDLLRDPRWGRAEECYTEAPALAAAFARAAVVGMQGADRARLADGTGVGVVLKHFAAQGGGVGGRNGHSAQVGPRDLAELHLPAARAGVAAGAVAVMAAYNDIDGVPCVANRGLLTELLRGQWGFDGLVMADGLGVDRIVEQIGAPLPAAAAALAAGVDLSLWDRSFALLEEAVGAAPALGAAVDLACARVLTVKAQFGLIPGLQGRRDETQHAAHRSGEPSESGTSARDARRPTVVLSRRLAERSAVLVRNGSGEADQPLPLRPGTRWVVTGPRAHDVECLLGDYVPPLPQDRRRSIATALHEAGERAGVTIQSLEKGVEDPSTALGEADGVVVVLGGSSHRAYTDAFADNGANMGETAADCGEGVDVARAVLPPGQVESLAAVRGATQSPVVAVVVAGRPYVLTDVLAHADAVLLAFYPGPHGPDALADLVLGAAQPVGRLPATLPADPSALPVQHDERMDAAGVYRDVPDPELRPLGAGLGYGRLRLVASRVEAVPGGLRVEADVAAAAGAWDAEEVIQVYVRRTGGLVWPRTAELAAWQRVKVAAGASARVVIEVGDEAAFIPPAAVAPLAARAAVVTVVAGSGREAHTVEPYRSPWQEEVTA